MSAATLRAGRPLPSATWRTAGWLVGRTLRILTVVAPLMLLFVVGVAPGIMAHFAVEAPGSLWSLAVAQALTFFTLVIGAMTMPHLPIHLAFGMTRRSFAAAVSGGRTRTYWPRRSTEACLEQRARYGTHIPHGSWTATQPSDTASRNRVFA